MNFLKHYLSPNQKLSLHLLHDIIINPSRTKYLLNRYKFNKTVLKKPTIDYTPPAFSATIVDNCNLRCPTCKLLMKNNNKFSNSYMDIDKFREGLDKYNKDKKAEIIYLDGGESLLHPQFDVLAGICEDYGLSVRTSTNGILIKDKIKSLIDLDYVNVSVDAYDYKSYKKYRGGSPRQFDLVLEGLRLLKENRVNFSMSFLLSLENLSEADKMIDLAKDIKPNFIYFHNINPHGSNEYKSLTMQDENTKVFLDRMITDNSFPFDVYISAIFDTNSSMFLDTQCIQPWYWFLFNSVGDVSYCCHLEHSHKIGNIFNDYDFNSNKMVEFRKSILQKKLPESCLYCQRRFMGKEFARFDSKLAKWIS